ncbi:MAG: VOC family protein [Planctomycetes bacterium]|nr:VOC family protein [Planctomycetota bacterium]
MLKSYDHQGIAFKDLPRAVAWYKEVLGLSEWAAVPGGAVMLQIAPGAYIEMMPASAAPRPERAIADAGASHLCFRVDDLDAAIARLDGFKVTWTNPISPAVGGGRLRNFLDLEGNVLQIVQR